MLAKPRWMISLPFLGSVLKDHITSFFVKPIHRRVCLIHLTRDRESIKEMLCVLPNDFARVPMMRKLGAVNLMESVNH